MNNYQRILISRTDRIGDVLLSTPAIKAFRRHFPQSYIAMMVRPYARDIVLGNPYLDEVIIYDKYGSQRSFYQTLKFAFQLKGKKFDLAVILHPTNRQHIISLLAGIKQRVGFNRKFAFLLTDKVEHSKQAGQKHELQYTLDLLRHLGLKPEDTDLFMPIRKDSEIYIEQFLTAGGWQRDERLVALHPAASCPSKIWPAKRFAQVAEQLFAQFRSKVVIIAGPNQPSLAIAKDLISQLRSPYIDASGQTSISQLASLLRRCCLFISNDSGPVHIAQALEIPVVAIFGRRQAGLSPQRWKPQGKDDIILHKDVGCRECLAHNCQKGFACLAAISVEEVLSAAKNLLKKQNVQFTAA